MSKVLIFGSGGFIGRHVSEEFKEAGHEVVDTYRNAGGRPGYTINLLDVEAVADVLDRVQPEIVVNCAGIVKNDETAKNNPTFTQNVINGILVKNIKLQQLVILGSAAEYGIVKSSELPVQEDTPLRANKPYGVSKIEEVALALKYREKSGLPIVVARVFNPIGIDMPTQQLVSRLISQIMECQRGERKVIQLSRLDAERDYIDVRDLARAIVLLGTALPKEAVYNIGSGKATTNGRLLGLLLDQFELQANPRIEEVSDQPEPCFASRADIRRMTSLGWEPLIQLNQTVKDIVNETK